MLWFSLYLVCLAHGLQLFNEECTYIVAEASTDEETTSFVASRDNNHLVELPFKSGIVVLWINKYILNVYDCQSHTYETCIQSESYTHPLCFHTLTVFQMNLIMKSYITFLSIYTILLFALNYICIVKHIWVTCSNQDGWSTALSQLYNPNEYYPDPHFESWHQNNPNLELYPESLTYN